MPTPVRERFSVQSEIRDAFAQVEVLGVPALVNAVSDSLPGGNRFIDIRQADYATLLAGNTVALAWAAAIFGQSLTPDFARIIYWVNSGTDSETIAEGMTDAINSDGDAYTVMFGGVEESDKAGQLALAQFVQSSPTRSQCVLMTQDPAAATNGDSTSILFSVNDQSLNRTTVIAHPASKVVNGTTVSLATERPDGAITGLLMSTEPGDRQWDYQQLSLTSDAGWTATQRAQIRTNNGNFIERFEGTTFTHMFPGRTSTNREIRIQWGADWFDNNVEAALATLRFQQNLWAFDAETFAGIEGIFNDWLQRALNKRLVVNTQLRRSVVTMPDPDSFPANVRAAGILSLSDLYDFSINSGIDQIEAIGVWRI